MDKSKLFSATTAEEAERILRNADFPVDSEALSFVTELYYKADNNYKYLALIADYYDIAKDTDWFPHEQGFYTKFIEGLYSVMYNEKDIARTLWAASLLADIYKGNNDKTLLVLCSELIQLCGNPVSNSTFFLITKEAITAAVNVIEAAAYEMPSKNVIALVFRILLYLPTCCHDGKFAVAISERISMLYNTASDTQLEILRMILPEFEQTFEFMHKALLQVDEDESNLTLQTLSKCKFMLFSDDKPKPLENLKVYDIIYSREQKNIKNALVFSAPDFGHSESGKTNEWTALIGSQLEGILVKDTLINNVNLDIHHLSGEEATLDALKKTLYSVDYNIIHFSTHGCLNKNTVGLLTANANQKNVEAVLWDSDLKHHSLHDTALVVYALCFGAKQTAKLNDSLSGFVKFSLMSGTNAIIAPLYPIQDLSSAVLLNEFYKAYIAVRNPEIALKQAIKRLRTISKKELYEEYDIETDKDYPFSAPEHWSPWICFSAQVSSDI